MFFEKLVDFGVGELQKIFDEITESDNPTLIKFEKLLQVAIKFSKNYPDLVKLYNEITTEGEESLIREFAKKIESISINAYKRIIEQAKKNDEIPDNIDTSFLAFCIDSLFVVSQFSFIPGYFHERMKVYLGDKYINNEDKYIQDMMYILSRSFGPSDY